MPAPSNRVEVASQGYMDRVEQTDTGWVAVGLMLVVAFFLVGYLIQRHMPKKRK